MLSRAIAAAVLSALPAVLVFDAWTTTPAERLVAAGHDFGPGSLAGYKWALVVWLICFGVLLAYVDATQPRQ